MCDTNDNSEYDEAAEEANGLEFEEEAEHTAGTADAREEQGEHTAGARTEQGKPGRARAVANRAQAAANRAQATSDRAHHAATEQSPVHKHNIRGRRARNFGHLKTVGYLNNVNRLKTVGTINKANSLKGTESLETYALCINALLGYNKVEDVFLKQVHDVLLTQ